MKELITRRTESLVKKAFATESVVAITGARQIGKTTLATVIAKELDALHFDLSLEQSLRELEESEIVLRQRGNKLIIIDEAQNKPDLYDDLHRLIDARRMEGQPIGRFLLLGSSGGVNLGQKRELTGRMLHIPMHGVDCLEIPKEQIHQLWERGGFPASFLEPDLEMSKKWRREYIDSHFGRNLKRFRNQMHTLLGLIAGSQGGIPNISDWSGIMRVDEETVLDHLLILEDLFLIRNLPRYDPDLTKRLRKRPKCYIRDSGLMHFLANASLPDTNKLSTTSSLAKDLVGASWEGFVVENLCGVIHPSWRPFFYRAHEKDEIDLIIEFARGDIWAIEIKLKARKPLTKHNHAALETLKPKPNRTFLVHSEDTEKILPGGIESVPLTTMMRILLEKAGHSP